MRGDRVAVRMRLIADGFDHLWRHFQRTWHALFLCVQHAAGDHQLHQVHAFRLRLRQHLQRLLIRVRCHGDRACHVPAGDGNALIGSENPGTDPASCGNFVAQPRVEAAETAHGADGRHAAEQLQLCKASHHAVGDGARQPACHDFFDERFIVALLFLRLAVACQMHVHVNQTRHQIPVLKIDHRIAVQVRVILYDGSNYFAVCQNRFPALRLHVLRAVENHAVCECIFHRCHLLFKSMRPFYHSFARFRQFFAMQKHSKIRNVPFPRPCGQPEILRQKTVAIFRRRWYDNKANYTGFVHRQNAVSSKPRKAGSITSILPS